MLQNHERAYFKHFISILCTGSYECLVHIAAAHKVSELDKQKEEEAKILHDIKEASALMSVAELAKGVVYTEPLVTGLVWRLYESNACNDHCLQLCLSPYPGGLHQSIFSRPLRVKIIESERSGTFWLKEIIFHHQSSLSRFVFFV